MEKHGHWAQTEFLLCHFGVPKLAAARESIEDVIIFDGATYIKHQMKYIATRQTVRMWEAIIYNIKTAVSAYCGVLVFKTQLSWLFYHFG